MITLLNVINVLDKKRKLVLIIAGEASADEHGSNLVRAMKNLDSGIDFWGIGGKKMAEAGVKTLVSSSEMAVVGLTEVLSRFHRITTAFIKLKNILKNHSPHLLILIDYPEFNLSLARIAKRYKVPVLYYISPQIWAWRKGRIKKITRRVDRMAVILPFEESFYRRYGLSVEYVGHPVLDNLPSEIDKSQITRELGLQGRHPILGLLPGSRNEEVKNLLPPMIRAAENLSLRYDKIKGILPLASTISPDLINSIIRQSSVDIKIFQGNIYDALALCDLAVVASGTATLETAIMGVPMIIVYKVSPITFHVAKVAVKVPYIGLVNLVAGKKVVPELIQNNVTPQRIADEALAILEDSRNKENLIKGLRIVKERLGRGGASERTARIAIDMIRTRP